MKYRQYIPIIIKNEGYRGLYRGFTANFLRDVPSWGVYFCSYDFSKEKLSLMSDKIFHENLHPDRRRYLITNLSGGIAGCVSWFMCYPLDVIKT